MNSDGVLPAGVVTLLQWTMMADGSTYMYVWAPEWRIVTNSATGIDGLRSAERFHVCAYVGDKLKVIIPGCQAKGFCACTFNPSLKGGSQIYTVE